MSNTSEPREVVRILRQLKKESRKANKGEIHRALRAYQSRKIKKGVPFPTTAQLVRSLGGSRSRMKRLKAEFYAIHEEGLRRRERAQGEAETLFTADDDPMNYGFVRTEVIIRMFEPFAEEQVSQFGYCDDAVILQLLEAYNSIERDTGKPWRFFDELAKKFGRDAAHIQQLSERFYDYREAAS